MSLARLRRPVRIGVTYLLAAALSIGGLPIHALAATFTWDGTTSLWSTSTNWNPSGPPGASDTALFAATGVSSIQLGGNQSIGNLTFSSGAGAFTFDSPGTSNMLLLGDLGTIWNQSGVTGLETIDDIVVLGPTSASLISDSSYGLLFGGNVIGSATTGISILNLSGASGGVGTISGNISDGTNGGVLALNKTGAGTWALSGANTYSGGTTISGGTLAINNASALGTGGVTIDYNATLATTTSFNFAQSLTLGAPSTYNVGGGTIDVASGTLLTVSSPISGTGGLIKTDGGTLVLDSTNTYQGLTQVKGGNLVLSGSLAATSSTTATIGLTDFLSFNGTTSTSQLILANGYTGFTLTASLVQSGGVGSSNALSDIISTGDNTLNGNIYITAGGSDTFITSTAGMLTITGNLVGTDSVLFPRGPGNQTYAGSLDNLSNSSFFTENVGTTIILSGNNNTYVGSIVPTYGTVRVSSGLNIGSGGVTFDSGELEVRADPSAISSFSTKNVTDGSNGTGSGSIFLSRAVGGSGLNQTVAFNDLTLLAGHTLTINGIDGYGISFTGSNSGAIGVGDNASAYGNLEIANTSSGLVSINASLAVGSTTASANATNHTFEILSSGDVSVSGSVLQTTTLSGTVLPAIFEKAGTGTTTLSGTASTYTGATELFGGTLAINQMAALNGGTGGVQLGTTTTPGALSYLGASSTGAGETTSAAFILAGTTGSGMILGNQQAASTNTAVTPLVVADSIASVGEGSKSFVLGGVNNSGAAAVVNEIAGVIQNESAYNTTGVIKFGSGTWLYAPAASTFTSASLEAASTQTTTTSTTASGATTITLGSASSLTIGQIITGSASIPQGDYITGISGNTITLSAATTATISGSTPLYFNGLASTTTASATTAEYQNVISLSSASGLLVGETVTGTGVPLGSVITAISGNNITISNPIAVAAGVANGANLYFSAISGFTGNVAISGGTFEVQPTAASGNGSAPLSATAGSSTTNNLVFQADVTTGDGYAGGVFQLLGTPSGITGSLATTVGQLQLSAGAATIETLATAGGGAPTLEFMNSTPISRTAGAVVDFVPGSGTAIEFNTVPTTNSVIVGAYFTNASSGAVDFATVTGSGAPYTVSAYSTYTTLPSTTTAATTTYQLSGGSITTPGAESLNALKLSGSAALTLSGALTITDGGILFDDSSGAATISGTGNLGVAQEAIITVAGSDSANVLSVSTPISSGTGSLTKDGVGTLVLSGTSSFTGNVNIDEGTLQLSGANANLLGVPAAGSVMNLRQNTIFDVNGAGASGTVQIGGLSGAGTVTNSGGGSNTAVTLNIGTNTTTASGVFSGTLQNGAGLLNVTVNRLSTSYTQVFSGLNTYTGVTTIAQGILEVTNLPSAGNDNSPSAIGELPAGVTAANSAPYLVFGSNNGSGTGDLLYQGNSSLIQLATASPSVTFDRLFTLAGNAVIDSSGTYGNDLAAAGTANNAALVFSNTGTIAFSGTGNRLLTLQGTSISDNQMAPQLVDNTAGGGVLAVTKAGVGTWWLSNNNTYSGATTITGGALRAQDAATTSLTATTTASTASSSDTLTVNSTAGLSVGEAIFGAGIPAGTTVTGFAGNTVTMSANASATVASGATIGFGSVGSGGLSANSNLLLNGGVLESSGSFTRSLGTGPGQVQFGSSATGSGFAASSSQLQVAIGGTANPTTLTWGSTNFLANGAALTLGSSSALSEVQILNPLNLGTYTLGQTITVNVNTSTDTSYGTILGAISGGPAGNGTNIGLIKTSSSSTGDLILAGANSYTGNTVVNGGVLTIYSLGGTSAVTSATTSSIGASGSAVTSATIGVLELTSGTLDYVGSGETSDRPIQLTAASATTFTLESNGSGPIILTNLTNPNPTTARTLDLYGYNTDYNTISSNLTDAAGDPLTINVDRASGDDATWVLSGNNTFTGGVGLGDGSLGLGSNTALGTGQVTVTDGPSLFAISSGTAVANNFGLSTGALLYIVGTNSFSIGTLYLGSTTAAATSATLNNEMASGTFTVSAISAQTGTASETLTINGPGNTIVNGAITNGSASGGLIVDYSGTGGSLTLGGSTASTFSGGFTLAATNTATLILSNTSTPLGSGSFIWDTGTIQPNAAESLANAVQLASGSTIGVTGSNSITFTGGETFTTSHTLTNNLASGSTLTFATGTMALGSAAALTLAGSGSTVISAPITGTATTSLVMNGSGSLTLGGTDTLSGTTAANAGTLTLNFDSNNSNKLSTTAALILGGGTLALQRITSSGSFTQTVGSITLTSGSDSHITISNGGLTGTTNLTSTGTITANVGAVFDFTTPATGTGTFNVSASTSIYGWATIDTSTGNFFTANSSGSLVAATTTSADLVTSWTSSENVTDSSGYNGTLTANTTINSLRFNETSGPSTVTMNSGVGLTITGGGILETPSVGSAIDTIAGGTLTAGTGVGELIVNQENTIAPLTIASAIVNGSIPAMPLVKASTGTLILSGANTYTGATYINEGTLQLSGGGTLGTLSNVVIGSTSTALLDLNGTSQTIGTLSSSGVTAGLGTLNIGSGTLTVDEATASTFSGELTGAGELAVTGTGTLTLNTASSTFSGAVTVGSMTAAGGLLELAGNGISNLPDVTSFTLTNGGALQLDNTGSSTQVQRVSTSVPIMLSYTPPSTTLSGISTTTDQLNSQNATIGAVTLAGGTNTLRAVTSTANSNPQLTMASLTRSDYSTLVLLATDLGSSNGAGSTPPDSPVNAERGDIIVSNPASVLNSLVGGNSNSLDTPTISILPWVVGQDASVGTYSLYGNTFVTYNTSIGNGFLALNPVTDYEQLVPTGGTTLLNNARYAPTSATNLTFTGTGHEVNSLLVDTTSSGGAITVSGSGSGDSLTVNSGAMLFVGAQPVTVNGFGSGIGLGAGISEYVITANNTTTTIASALTSSGAVITKSGTGTLILNDALPNGPIYVNEGTLGLAATSPVSGNVTIALGASLSLLSAGDGTGSVQTITTMEDETFTFLSGVPVFTVGPVGAIAADKTIEANTGNTISLAANTTLTVNYSNGFGLQLDGTVSLPTTAPATLATGTTTAQTTNTIQVLTIAGTLTGGPTGAGNVVFNKTGAADLVLTNSGNSFGGSGSYINVQQGMLGATSDAALGDPNNVIELNPTSSSYPATFAALGTFATSRTILFGTASYTRQIDVSTGNTLTLNSPFGVSLAPTASLTKTDAGTLVFGSSVNNSGWTGALTISQGAVELTGNNNLSSTTTITANAGGAALQLDGVSISNPLSLASSGILEGGELEAVGANSTSTVSGTITSGTSSLYIGADPTTTLDMTGTFSGTASLVFMGGGTINLSGAPLPAYAGLDVYNLKNTTPTSVVLGVNGSAISGNADVNVIDSSLQVGNGTTGVGNIGTLNATSYYVEVINSTLTVDDAGGSPEANRLGGSMMVLYNSTFNYIVNGTSSSSESIGELELGLGTSTIAVTNTGNQNYTLTFSSLIDLGSNFGSMLDFEGTFGTATQKILFTTAPALSPASTGILANAIVGTPGGAGNGISFATYGSNGITTFSGYVSPSDLNVTGTTATTSTVMLASSQVFDYAKLTLNALDFNAGTATSLAGVANGGTTLAVTSGNIMVTNNTAATIGSGVVVSAGVVAGVMVNSGSSLVVNGTISNSSYFDKDLGGSLTFNAPQFFATAAYFSIEGGTVTLNGGNNTIYEGVGGGATAPSGIDILPGATLDLDGNSQMTTLLVGAHGFTGDGGTITSSQPGGTVVLANRSGETFGGSLTGDLSYALEPSVSTYSEVFTAASTYDGSTLVTGAIFELEDQGQLSSTSSVAVNYAELELNDNNYVTMTNRVNPSATTTLEGGTLFYQGRAQTISYETLGAVVISQGLSTIDVAAGGTGVNSADLQLASFSQTAGSGAMVNFVGSSLGLIGSNTRLGVTGATTPTVTNNIIGGWAIVNGTDFASYIPYSFNSTTGVGAGGFGALGSAGFPTYDATAIPAISEPTQNIKISAGSIALPSGGLNLNTLNWATTVGTQTITFTNNSDVLNLSAGGLLKSGGFSNTIGSAVGNGAITAGGTAMSGTQDLYITNSSSTTGASVLTIDSAIIDTQTALDSGTANVRLDLANINTATYSGTIALAGANTYSGGTIIDGGTVTLNGAASTIVIPAGGVTLNGATLSMNTNSGQIAAANTITLNGLSTLTLVGSNTLNSLVFDNNGGTTAPATNPTVNVPASTVLTLTNPTPITVSSLTPSTIPTLPSGGSLDFSGAASVTLQINPITFNSQNIAPLTPSIDIATVIQNDTANTGVTGGVTALTVAGGGLLELSGANTFSGGVSLTGGSGLDIVSSSTGSPTVTSGPLGTGTLSIGDGSYFANSTATTSYNIGNAYNVAGSFSLLGITGFTLSGAGTFNSAASTIDIPAPQATLTLSGALAGYAGMTLTKTGDGTLSVTNNNTFASGTSVVLDGGNLIAGGSAGATPSPLGSATITVNGGVLELLNNGTASGTLISYPNVIDVPASNTYGVNLTIGDLTANTSSTVRIPELQMTGGQTLSVAANNSYSLRILEIENSSTTTPVSVVVPSGVTVTVYSYTGDKPVKSSDGTGTLNFVANPNQVWWYGGQDTNWDTVNGTTTIATNWSSTSSANTDALALPGSNTDVYFSTASPTAGHYTTTLGMDFTINSLTLGAGGSATNSTTIAGTNTLTLMAAADSYVSAGTGIEMLSGAAASTISANIALGASQTWTNSSTNTLTIGGTTGNTLTGSGYSLTIAGSGNTTISDPIETGAGGLAMSGTGTLTLLGANSYSGTTTVGSGTLALGPGNTLTGTAISVASGATLSTLGNTTLGTPSAGSLAIAGGGTLSMENGSISTLSLSNNTAGAADLSLGSALGSPVALLYDISSSSESVSTISVAQNLLLAASGATISLDNLAGSGVLSPGTYTLMSFASGSTLTGAFTFDGTHTSETVGNGETYTLNTTSTGLQLVVTANPTPNPAYWSGAQNATWSYLANPSNASNWLNGPTGTDTNQIPASSTDVFLTANTAANLSTTLGQDFTINSLTFTGAGTTNTFGSSIAGSNTLTILAAAGAYSAGTGVTVQSGSGADTISANVALGANQTWNLAANTLLSVSGTISESTAGTTLTLAGSGTLVLSGNNAFSGGTSVAGGTLEIGSSTVLASGAISTGPIGTGTLSLGSGSTLEDNGSAQTLANALSLAGNITLTSSGAGTLTFDPTGLTTATTATLTGDTSLTVNNTTTINETIGGAYNLTVGGTGTLVFGGNNTYSGTTTLDSGTLRITSNNSLGSTSGLVLAGGTLDSFATAITYAGPVSGTGTIYVPSGDTLTLSGTVDASITATGGGTLDITNNSGSTMVQTGVYNTSPTGAGNITLENGGTVNFTSGGTDSGNITVASGNTGYVNNSSGQTVTLSGTITKTDAGLIFGGSGSLLVSGQITGSSSSFDSDASFTTDTVLTNSNNNYFGNTFIYENATVSAGVTNAMPGSTILTLGSSADNTSGMFDLAGFSQTLSGLQTAGSGSTNLVTNSNGTTPSVLTISNFTSGAGSLPTDTFAGQLTGNLSLVKTNSGTLVLASANSYSGNTGVTGGTLRLGIADGLPSGTVLTISGTGSTFDLAGYSQQVAGLSDGGTTAGTITDSGTASTLTVNSATSNTFNGSISGEYLSLAMSGAGSLSLGGTNSYGGGTSISTGTITISSDGNLGAASGAVTLTGGGTLVLNGSFSSDRNFSFGSGGGNLSASSGQTFTASGNGTWSSTGGSVMLTGPGTVQLNAGTGSYGSADNPLSITLATGTLTGTATVLGNITINSGATISPGASSAAPGTLTFNGYETGGGTLSSGGIFDFNITSASGSSTNSSTGSAGTNWNLLSLNSLSTGGLSSAQPFDITATSSLPANFNPNSSYQWDIITAAGGLPGGLSSSDFSLNTTAYGTQPGSFSVAVSTTSGGVGYVAIDYSPSAVPEPGSMVLSGLAALGMLGIGWRQRRRKQLDLAN